ncbi:MAG: hypothetical protein HN687_09045, partial [Candidatus Marinimicrobia bacterium]|nr:hypothetical protein [Candidatus Neomarinimicrobiota bacterium]
MIKRFLLLLLFVLLPKGLFATITQSGTTSISGTTGWMYINSADDGSGNTYWNNTSYYMTCEFTVPNTPDANFAIKLAIDTDDDGDYVNESWVTIGAEYTGGTTTFSEDVIYTNFNNQNPSPFSNDGKKFKIYVHRDNQANNVDTLELSGTFIYKLAPPSTPGTPDLQSAYDSGTSTSDNETNLTSVLFDISNIDVSGSNFEIELIDGPWGFFNSNGSRLLPYITTTESPTTLTYSGLTNDGGVSNNHYYIRSVVKNQFGSIAQSSSLIVKIDTQAPSQPAAPDLDSGSDTGNSNSDELTYDATPTFRISSGSGNFDTDDRIQLYLDGSYITLSDSTPNSDSYNYFDITPSSNVTEGTETYAVTVKIVDDAGNISSESGSLSITVDTDAPSQPGTPDLSTSDDTGNSSSDNLTKISTAIDITIGSVTALDSVKLKFGSTEVGWEKVGSGNSSASFTINDQTEGNYNVTAIAYDPAGNVSISSEIMSLSIDTSVPNTPNTPDLIASSDLGANDSDNETSDSTPTVTFGNLTLSDSLIIYNAGSRIQSELINATSMDITLSTALEDGAHTLSAKSKDPAGNISNGSSNLGITIDTSAPSSPNQPDLKATSDSGFSESDNYTSDETPTFTITGVSETDSVVFSIGGQTMTEIVALLATSVEVTVPVAMNDGTYTGTAVAYDLGGNASATSNGISVTIDTQAPGAADAPDLYSGSDTGREDDDNITNETQPQFTVSNVTSGDSLLLVFENQSGGSKDTTGSVLANASTASFISSTLAAATYNVNVIAVDQAGNSTGGSSFNSFQIDLTAPSAPNAPNLTDASDTGILNSDDLTNDQTPSFAITGVSSGDSIVLAIGTEAPSNIATGSSITLTVTNNLASDTYSVTSKAIDLAGNESNASDALSIEIDATAPNAPSSIVITSATDTGVDDSDAITTNQQAAFTISGLHSSNRDSIDLFFNSSRVASGRTDNGNTTIELGPSSDQPEGTYSVTAIATDSSSNVSDTSGVYTLIIDLTAPTAPNTPDLLTSSDLGRFSSDDITSDNTPSFNITNLTANDSIYLVFSTDTVARGLALGASLELTTTEAIDDGTYSVKALSRDPAGNLSSASSSLSGLEIDTSEPTAPTSVVLQSGSDSGISTTDRLTNDTTPTFTIEGVTSTDSV